MRPLLLAGLMLVNTNIVMANECDINFDGNLQLENRVLTITTSDKTKVLIQENNQLYVNGKHIKLNAEQQNLVSAYYAGIYAAAPQAARIASDAVQLASVTINEVFNELLGNDSDAVDTLTLKLNELGEHIQNNFYAQNGEIRLNSANFDDGNFLSNEWEDEFEDAIEDVVANSIGRIMLSIGSELLFGGGDMDAFEAKMERFGQDIEQRVEYQTSGIEARADALCHGLAKVDLIETQLQKSIPALADLNILRVEQNHHAM
ncbi:DUF2884 family protein [Paraglaciecola hydrolytica]|uniref:DUF2884 family protein n=1 Tax=Paraglaciecola hydrolytica TaxID=1799789 RepID=A0A136A2T5_9ALTE|nr:DUF2884 family protein [Paraglaciecola hydrolytica]KXI29545.1 hypothetical protein AX660_05670 [Paraglaciecola hydrolytica]